MTTPGETAPREEQVRLLSDRDRLRVAFRLVGGVPTDIMVELECNIDDRWVPGRRYDMHETLQVHTAPWDTSGADRRVLIPTGGMK